MRVASIALIGSLIAPSAFAAESLAPGKPAGVKDAQEVTVNSALLAAGIGTVVAGLIMVATDDGDDATPGTPPPTSTSTSGTP